jgi:ribosomal protein S10
MNKIVINSSSKKSLVLYTKFLTIIFKKLNLTFSVFSSPTTRKRVTLLKSPHVFKKAKEHFEIKNFQTILSFNYCIETKALKFILLNKPKSITMQFKF